MPHLPPNSELSTTLTRETEGMRLMLHGELDMNGVLDTERAVAEAAAMVPEGRLTIDLSDLSFMDLFGARALLRAADEALSPTREVQIAHPQRHARRLFELNTDLARGRSLVSELVRP
jgi:anti-anti-sigma factor